MRKHHPVHRSPAGLEWSLFRKIPHMTIAGLSVLGVLWAAGHYWPWESNADKQFQQFEFALIGAAIFLATMLVTLAIGCVVVLIMKGPRYSADSYPVEDAERPGR
jgi:hypothetical protein